MSRPILKKISLVGLLGLMIRRDLLLAVRRRADVLTTLIFFIIVASLFPLAIGSEMGTLRTIAPGVVWVAALLASMLSLGRMFSADYLDGTLEQMMLAPQSLSTIVLAKIFAHWVVSGLPLVIIAPILGLQFDMSAQALWVLIFALLLGTPILSMVGAVGAALTLGLRGGGALVSLLVLPLCIPVLIFGAGAVEAVASGSSVSSHLALLGALLLAALTLSPWVTALALRISME
jgi:heme exporter protein B